MNENQTPDNSRSVADHRQVLAAFQAIEDKNALAWSILDTKSETAITRAIAVAANRVARARVAYVEYPPRVDLVFCESGSPIAAYEAKAAYVTDFQERRISKNDWYLGECTDDDLVKLAGLNLRHPTMRQVLGIFFIYEVGDPTKQLKYGGNPRVEASRALEALASGVKLGRLSATGMIDCGQADGNPVKVHMCIFDPVATR